MLANLVIRERWWMSAFGISIEGFLMAGSACSHYSPRAADSNLRAVDAGDGFQKQSIGQYK